ncbi:MAG: PspC domain-containing protein [Clostridiales bacterium]|nr:PspC domain-containing protein [Clostridiales bacterium]
MICGVCGGIGVYFSIDPTLVRLAWVLVTVCSFGLGIVAYIIAAIVVPTEKQVRNMDIDI